MFFDAKFHFRVCFCAFANGICMNKIVIEMEWFVSNGKNGKLTECYDGIYSETAARKCLSRVE